MNWRLYAGYKTRCWRSASRAGLLLPHLFGYLFNPGAPFDLERHALLPEPAEGGAQQDGPILGVGLPAEARRLADDGLFAQIEASSLEGLGRMAGGMGGASAGSGAGASSAALNGTGALRSCGLTCGGACTPWDDGNDGNACARSRSVPALATWSGVPPLSGMGTFDGFPP